MGHLIPSFAHIVTTPFNLSHGEEFFRIICIAKDNSLFLMYKVTAQRYQRCCFYGKGYEKATLVAWKI